MYSWRQNDPFAINNVLTFEVTTGQILKYLVGFIGLKGAGWFTTKSLMNKKIEGTGFKLSSEWASTDERACFSVVGGGWCNT